MEKQSTMNNKTLRAKYIEYTLEHNAKPKSVYLFAKHIGITESQFYKHFGSFKALEGTLFVDLFQETTNGNIEEGDPKRKLTSIYHAYFENWLNIEA